MKKQLFDLVELTSGPWYLSVHRSEYMTKSEARAINGKMSGTVLAWRLSKSEKGKS